MAVLRMSHVEAAICEALTFLPPNNFGDDAIGQMRYALQLTALIIETDEMREVADILTRNVT